MTVLRAALTAISINVVRAADYISRHPGVFILLGGALLGGVIGWVIVAVALLVNPMRGLFMLLYVVLVPTALLSIERDRCLSLRLWVGMLTSVMGLLTFRLACDLIGLEKGFLRSNLTGTFGLICGIAGFLKIRC